MSLTFMINPSAKVAAAPDESATAFASPPDRDANREPGSHSRTDRRKAPGPLVGPAATRRPGYWKDGAGGSVPRCAATSGESRGATACDASCAAQCRRMPNKTPESVEEGTCSWTPAATA